MAKRQADDLTRNQVVRLDVESTTREHVMPPSGFRTIVALDSPYLERDGKQFRISAGMAVSAEIHLGSRTVMEYLLSPVQKVTYEAERER